MTTLSSCQDKINEAVLSFSLSLTHQTQSTANCWDRHPWTLARLDSCNRLLAGLPRSHQTSFLQADQHMAATATIVKQLLAHLTCVLPRLQSQRPPRTPANCSGIWPQHSPPCPCHSSQRPSCCFLDVPNTLLPQSLCTGHLL